MTKEEIQKFIKKNKERHLSNKVLHAHPSPAQWQTNFSKEKINNNLMTSDGEKTLINMYIGIPYCLPTVLIVVFVYSQQKNIMEKRIRATT
jgi:hypothetical protein